MTSIIWVVVIVAIILLFTAVFVFGMNQVANELDHVDYDTAVMSKDIIVPRQPNIAYTLNGEYVRFRVDTSIGQSCKMKGNTVVKAPMLRELHINI